MARVSLKYGPTLTPEQAQNFPHPRLRNWWIARLDKYSAIKSFVRIPERSAVNPLDLTLDLKPGRYLMGNGHGRNKFAKRFDVDLMGLKFI